MKVGFVCSFGAELVFHFCSLFLFQLIAEEEEDPRDSLESKKFGTRKLTAKKLQKMRQTRFRGHSVVAFLNQLPDLKYEVTKINQYGARQHRTLKLTW